MQFNSRRSTVHSTKGVVSSTQPLANAAGLKVLEAGGNAAMAAVAVAAAIGVTEPMMNSIGGDAFALYYDSKSKTVSGFNGSGKTPAKTSLEEVKKQAGDGDQKRIPGSSIHSVTVPGAAASWEDVVTKWGNGKLSLADIIQPAIELAENGFPVAEITAQMWESGVKKLQNASPNGGELLMDSGDPAPKEGQVFVNKNLAAVLKRVAKDGKNGFYKGETADKIIEIVKQSGGTMTHEDLANHETLFLDPISVDYKGVRLHEIPPNGQGLVALQALGTINQLEKRGIIGDVSQMGHNSAEYLHLLAETLKFGFKDGEEYIADYEKLDYNPNDLLTEEYLNKRADLFSGDRANQDYDHGVMDPNKQSDTVYFTVSDAEGNACSFITSIYTTFGSGIVPEGCGFPLQNRGCGFSLDPESRNAYGPSKRPYHTIIPGMVTDASTREIYAAYGVMGGFMQPQGQVQVLNNMVLFGMNPQQALDAPRLCLTLDSDYPDTGLGADSPISTSNRTIVALEEGISDEVADKLEKMGHKVKRGVSGQERGLFGRGQVIKRVNGRVWGAGSDPRGDGAAVGQV